MVNRTARESHPRHARVKLVAELAGNRLPNLWCTPAVTAMMMGWKRACFAQPPASAGQPADIEVRRDRALPRAAAGQLGSLVTICLDGMSLLAAVHRQDVGAPWRFGVSGEFHHKQKRLSTGPTNGKRWNAGAPA